MTDAMLLPLRQAQVPPDATLVVHSAIARLSRRGYRAEEMIETWLRYLDCGTLVMPTMSWRIVTLASPYWDERATPSETGVLTEVFRRNYATHRSVHPTHSVAACGALAEELLSRHHVDTTPVSVNSPYGMMRDKSQPTYVLMLGVGLECCTAIHLGEELFAPDIYLKPEIETYFCTNKDGLVHTVGTRRHRRMDRDFNKFKPALAERGQLQQGSWGDCSYLIVKLDALLNEVIACLAKTPTATLRLQ